MVEYLSVAVAAIGILIGFLGARDPVGKRMFRSAACMDLAERVGRRSKAGRELEVQAEREALTAAWMLRERNEQGRRGAKFGVAFMIAGVVTTCGGVALDFTGWISTPVVLVSIMYGLVFCAAGSIAWARSSRDAVTLDELTSLAAGEPDQRPWWVRG